MKKDGKKYKIDKPHGRNVELVEWCGWGKEKDWRYCAQCVVRLKSKKSPR